jgi:hypothetical protein
MLWKPNHGLGVVIATYCFDRSFTLGSKRAQSLDFRSGDMMSRPRNASTIGTLGIISVMAISLGACGTFSGFGGGASQPAAQEAPAEREMPASIRADEIVGRWGLASYQNPNDRPRTELAAKGQCKQPYVIGAGTSGGVIMHLADEATPQELRLKGSSGGKNYIGPPGPAGGEKDREIVSFDGRVMVTRFIDPDAATRYGNMVYVRCGPRA